MIEVLLTAIPSLCWILYRCFQLLKTPSHRLMQQLNVDIPRFPSVCVDKLSPRGLSVHWDADCSADENVYFVVLVNGKDAGTLTNTSVTLSNLHPGKLYQLQVLAINVVTNFRSQSAAVYVRTPSGSEPQLVVRPPADAKAAPHGLAAAGEWTAADVAATHSEPALMAQLLAVQHELTRVTHEFGSVSQKHRQEEADLRKELQAFRKELNDGADVRCRKGTDLRDLEKQKDSLAFTKLKLSKQLKNIHNHRNIRMGELENLRVKAAKLAEKRDSVARTVREEKLRNAQCADDLHIEMDRMRSEVFAVEEAVRNLTAHRKELKALSEALKPLVHQFVGVHSGDAATPVSAITRDGHLSDHGAVLLRDVFALKPDWESDICAELAALADLERTWKSKFRACIKRYTSLHNQLEITRATGDPGYEPRHLSEYQASVNFGGHASAIKPRKKPLFSHEPSSHSPSPMRELSYDDLQNISYGDLMDASPQAEVPAFQDPSSSLEAFNTYTRQYAPDPEFPAHADSPDLLSERNLEPMLNPSLGLFSQNPSQAQSLQDLAPQGTTPYAGDSQVYGTPMAMSPPPYHSSAAMSQPYLGEYQNAPMAASEPQLPIPIPALHGASDIRKSFEQPQYISPSDGRFIQPQAQHQNLQSLWGNTSQSSLFEGRRPYVGLSMSPSLVDPMHMPMAQNLHADKGIFNNLMVPGAGNLPKSIWSDTPMNTSYSHNRTVSGGSQLWRSEGRRERSPTVGFSGEFTPFSSDAVPSQNGARDEIDLNDIRSL